MTRIQGVLLHDLSGEGRDVVTDVVFARNDERSRCVFRHDLADQESEKVVHVGGS